jgi:hypothetical protein
MAGEDCCMSGPSRFTSCFAIFAMLFSLFAIAPATAQKRKPAASSTKELEKRVAESRAEVVRTANDYKASVEKLIVLIEKEVAAAREVYEKRKRLVDENIISRRELEEAHRQVLESEAKLSDARKQIADSDNVIAEVKALEQLEKDAAARRKSYVTTAALIRFSGSAGWMIRDAAKVGNFFSSKFGRALPISAFGQSETHNRLGWDHSNSMDVALHPDSAEGQALIAFLRSAGIPFLAFRTAIPGSSTGPHIHIGYPSHRLGR